MIPLVGWVLLASGYLVGTAIFSYAEGCVPFPHLEVITNLPDFVGYDYPGCTTDWVKATQEHYLNHWDALMEDWIDEITEGNTAP